MIHGKKYKTPHLVLNYVLPRNADWSVLNKTETKILHMRWAMGEYKKRHNHREIVAAMGIPTCEKVSYIERVAVKKLRETL